MLFASMPLLVRTRQFNTIPLLCNTPLCPALLCCSFALQLSALLCNSIPVLGRANRIEATPLPVLSSSLVAIPLRCITRRCHPLAGHVSAQLFRCRVYRCVASLRRYFTPLRLTVAAHSKSRQVTARPRKAVALQRYTPHYRCVTRSPPSGNDPFQSFATGRCRRTVHSPATPARPSHGRRTGTRP